MTKCGTSNVDCVRRFGINIVPGVAGVVALAWAGVVWASEPVNPLANEGEYALHADGGIIYNPLSREALRKGELAKFLSAQELPAGDGRLQGVQKRKGTLVLGDVTLTYEVPQAAEAYDVVPVKVVLENKGPAKARPLAVECTAFEESARAGGRPLFDMSLPGDLSAKIEYVGSVCADAAPSRPLLDPRQPDPEIRDYPGWKSDARVRSGVIRKADYVWFTFKYTVTGNTIFDPEGFNGVQTQVDLFRKELGGRYKPVAQPINKWERNVNYQYPGESCEQTVMMSTQRKLMAPGEYKLRFSLQQKAYTRWTQYGNHWGGEPFAWLDVYLKVVKGSPVVTEPKVVTGFSDTVRSGNFPEYLHSFEEFMTGFEWFRNPFTREASVIYVQVAPWTEKIDVKLIMGNPMELRSVSIPVAVSRDKITLRYNPDNPFVVQRNGLEEPVILGQLMPSMRHSAHFGPRPDLIMRDLVKDAMACGVNVYVSESGTWALDDFFRTPANHDVLGEATRYFNYTLKEFGMPMIGHGVYPIEGACRYGSKILGVPLEDNTDGGKSTSGYGAKHLANPNWSRAWASVVLYNHALYGDNWYTTRDGKTIIDIEDTVGWLREGINIRYPAGDGNIKAFQTWCRRKYGTIENANQVWHSSFRRFDDINPEANQKASVPWGHKWEYCHKTNPVFYEWSPAMEDYDTYLSEARCLRYKDVLEIVRHKIPGAVIDLRTEGGNFIIPDSTKLGDTPHDLHVKYSARRNAEIGEVLARYKDVIGFYSDYPTLPFSPDEWSKYTRLSVEQGIRPMPLPHIARTRDMALQQKWGDDFTVHYNLKHPAKAAMVFRLQAFFPVMKSVYEAGGGCGIIWADYLCDAFVTETQKKELKILREAMSRLRKPALVPPGNRVPASGVNGVL